MKRRVALIIETSSSYGRDLLDGIVRFMRLHNEWSVFLDERSLTQDIPTWLANWTGDGIISRTTTAELKAAAATNQVPLIELNDRRDLLGTPHVRSEDYAIGCMAAEHLLERGFRRYGFCGFDSEDWSERRQQGFVGTLKDAGFVCEVYSSMWHGPAARAWEDELSQLEEWVGGFEQPIGVMACNDVRGQQILDVCSKLSIAVPEDVAVLGVDNDELLCSLCNPPLSSVIPNARIVGFRAAELLAHLMNNGGQLERGQLIAPLGVATRQSTDVVAIDDPEISAALRFIRENACRGINVRDVTCHVPVSRSTLERQLRKHLGRTPQQEIRRVQIRRAQELLATTDLTTERIAALCGFEHTEYFHVVFRRELNVTPGDFRKSAQP